MTTDSGRNPGPRREYEPYGYQTLPTTLEDGPGYTGHVTDAATGLVYMQQRYYDPLIERFLSRDEVTAYQKPLTNFNPYVYANNNPYRFTDPDGRENGSGYATGSPSGYTLDPKVDPNLADDILEGANWLDARSNDVMAAFGPYGGFEERAVATPIVAAMKFIAVGMKAEQALAEGVKLTGGGAKVFGNLEKGLKDVSAAEAIKLRGGGASQVRQLSTRLQQAKVGEIANAAAKGDKEAKTAMKIIKQAEDKAQKYGSK